METIRCTNIRITVAGSNNLWMKIVACNHSNSSNSHLSQISIISNNSSTYKALAGQHLNLVSKHPKAKRRLIIVTLILMVSGYSNNNLFSRSKMYKGSRTSNHNSKHSITTSPNRPQISKTTRLLQLGHKAKILFSFSSSNQTILEATKEVLLETT